MMTMMSGFRSKSLNLSHSDLLKFNLLLSDAAKKKIEEG